MVYLQTTSLIVILFINLVKSNNQLINFVPETEDFDLIASESIADQYSQVLDLTSEEYLKECLDAHNEKRKLHGSEELVYDEKLLNDAKEAAFQSALKGKLLRIEDSPYGENLVSSTKRMTCRNSVSVWYKQGKFYNYHVPLYTKETGGFTQIVWRETKRFACAQARLKSGGSRYFTVCVYDPFGNVSGQFRANVLPPIQSTDQITNVSGLNTTTHMIPRIAQATSTAKPTSASDEDNISTTNEANTTDTELHEATLNVSPLVPNEASLSRNSLVKPIFNKTRLSPGMLVKLKNLNKKKIQTNANDSAKINTEKSIEASASEVDLTFIRTFVQHNTISPTLNTIEISNLINRNQSDIQDEVSLTTETVNLNLKNSNDDLTTTGPF